MALQWNWDSKCGEAVFKRTYGDESKEFTVNLYEGNAYLIFIYEYKENGEDMYNLQGFFADKKHMKRCLGIDKQYKTTYGENIYNKERDKMTKVRFNTAKSRNYKEIIKALMEAFDEIEIELYKED